MATVKVGVKKRHLEVPDGAVMVTSGMVLKDDLIANIHVPCWTRPDADEVNTPAEWYDAVCRPPKKART